MISESQLEVLNYDDVLFLPKHSDINSREDINLYLNGKKHLPIFSAPMQNISEPKFVAKLSSLGGRGILHRFFKNDKNRYKAIDKIYKSGNEYGISVSINNWESELKLVKYAIKRNCKYVVIDTASGYLEKTIEAVKSLYLKRKDWKYDFDIISGNVVDQIGCLELAKAGTDGIRINIGTGLQCLTSVSISIGCPALTAIKDCATIKKKYPHIMLIGDGGIYTPGRALQALAFGCDAVMIGSLFGKAKECGNKGEIYGMSSFKLQERQNKEKKSNEGKVTHIPKEEIVPLVEIFNEFTWGLKSGLSYLGCYDINYLHDMDIEYIKVK